MSKSSRPSITHADWVRRIDQAVIAANGKLRSASVYALAEAMHPDVAKPSRPARSGGVRGQPFTPKGKNAVEAFLQERILHRPESAEYRRAIDQVDLVDGTTPDLKASLMTSRGERILADRGARVAPTTDHHPHKGTTGAAIWARIVETDADRAELLLRLVQTRPMYSMEGHLELCELKRCWRIPAAQAAQHADKDAFDLISDALDAAFVCIGVGPCR
jgi:hypothetical protein